MMKDYLNNSLVKDETIFDFKLPKVELNLDYLKNTKLFDDEPPFKYELPKPLPMLREPVRDLTGSLVGTLDRFSNKYDSYNNLQPSGYRDTCSNNLYERPGFGPMNQPFGNIGPMGNFGPPQPICPWAPTPYPMP